MLTQIQWADASIVGLLGLLVGSFLNVVVHRLPVMMERAWTQECAEFSGKDIEATAPFNLMVPRSRCPHCQHQIRWFENIPVLSYAALGGKCASCKTPIGLRYPLVELVCGGLFFGCAWRWGVSEGALAWCVFSAMLLAMALIDWDTTLLPDSLTLPLLWLGLIAADLGWTTVPLHTALWGAIAGYMSLWSIYWAFKLLTGKEGMGFGDFKLFAALGAWFGWPLLIPLILIASLVGAVIGVVMKYSSGLRKGGYVPFGPFLALAGFAALFFGPVTLRAWIGL